MPFTLRERHRLAPRHHPHPLRRNNLEPLGVLPQRLHRRDKFRPMSLVIGSQERDNQIKLTFIFVEMIGYVRRNVAILAIGFHQHAILTVTKISRAEPLCSLVCIRHTFGAARPPPRPPRRPPAPTPPPPPTPPPQP